MSESLSAVAADENRSGAEPPRDRGARRDLALAAAIIVSLAAAALYWTLTAPTEHFIDFEKAYYPAGVALWNLGPSGLRPLIADARFVNIPILAWLFVPFGLFSRAAADLLYLAAGLSAVFASWMLLRSKQRPLDPRLIALIGVNGPLWNSIFIGNSTHFVLLLLVVALTLLRSARGFVAGCLIGLAAMIKLPLLLMLPFLALRGRVRATAGMAASITLIVLGSILACGAELTAFWFRAIVLRFLGHPMAAFNVQSVQSFLARFEGFALNDWRPHALSPAGTLLGDLAIVAVALGVLRAFGREPAGKGRDQLAFCAALVACLIVGTVSWTHYYLLLLLPWALFLSGRLQLEPGRITSVLVWVSVTLCSLPVFRPPPELAGSLFVRILASAWLFGAAALLCAMARGGSVVRALEDLRMRLRARTPT